MNKQNHKLEDLLRAAREESPVVSFSETADQIARVEAALQQGSRRHGLLWWWEKAFAFPNAVVQRVSDVVHTILPEHPVFTRLVSGMALVATVMIVFPHLTHDGVFSRGKGNEQTVPAQTERSAFMSGQKDAAQKFSKNFRKNTSQRTQQLASLPILITSDSLHKEAPALSQNNAHRSAEDALEQSSQPSSAQTSGILIAQTPPNTERSVVIAAEQPLQNIPQKTLQAAPEETFWNRLSVEARVATRSALAPAASTSTLNPTESASFRSAQQLASESASPLQNIALGVMYALDEHHSIGIEGGTEPFLSAVRPGVERTQGGTGSLATNTMDSTRSLGTGAPTFIATVPTDKNVNSMQTAQTTETRNRAWFGAAYQYNFLIIEALGGIQPLARLTLGGGEIGFVGRTIIGMRFLPQNQFSVLLAGEGAGIGSPDLLAANSVWKFTPKIGLTLGLSVKF